MEEKIITNMLISEEDLANIEKKQKAQELTEWYAYISTEANNPDQAICAADYIRRPTLAYTTI